MLNVQMMQLLFNKICNGPEFSNHVYSFTASIVETNNIVYKPE